MVDTDALDVSALSTAQAALDYVYRGFRIVIIHGVSDGGCTCQDGVDCASAGKHPRLYGWHLLPGATDPRTVGRWYRRYPCSNVGLAMGGPQRLVALDVDGLAGSDSLAALSAELGRLPPTLTSRSGRHDGGHHLLFTLPAGASLSAIRNHAGRSRLGRGLAPGLDVRADGGQIVAPPSLHLSGGRYAWADTRAPAELPAAWVERLTMESDSQSTCRAPAPSLLPAHATRSAAYARRVLEHAAEELPQAPHGTRNCAAARLAYSVGGYLWTGAYSADQAHDALLAAAASADWPRLHRVSNTVRRQLSAGSRAPRELPPPRMGDCPGRR